VCQKFEQLECKQSKTQGRTTSKIALAEAAFSFIFALDWIINHITLNCACYFRTAAVCVADTLICRLCAYYRSLSKFFSCIVFTSHSVQ